MKRHALALFALLVASGSAFGQNSLSLHDATERAETSNPAQEGQGQVDAAQGLLRQAGLHPDPRLYMQSEDLRPWANDIAFGNRTEDDGYVGQTFELNCKQAKRVDVAEGNLRRTEAERQLLDQQIAGRVAGAYSSVVTSTRIVTLLEEDTTPADDIAEELRVHIDRVAAVRYGVNVSNTHPLVGWRAQRPGSVKSPQIKTPQGELVRLDQLVEIRMDEAVHRGAADRLRPVLITALVALVSSHGTGDSRGAEFERPLATVVIGGLITATALTLYILPLLYPWFSRDVMRAKTAQPSEPPVWT